MIFFAAMLAIGPVPELEKAKEKRGQAA